MDYLRASLRHRTEPWCPSVAPWPWARSRSPTMLVMDGVLAPPVASVAVPVAAGWSIILHRVARRWREEDASDTGPAGTPSCA